MKKIAGKQKETRMTLRLPASLYAALKKAAAKDGLPLNTYCLYILSRAIGAEEGSLRLIMRRTKKTIDKGGCCNVYI